MQVMSAFHRCYKDIIIGGAHFKGHNETQDAGLYTNVALWISGEGIDS